MTDGSPGSSFDAPISILWFRQDLRLSDQAALRAAMAQGGRVLPLYVLDDAGDAPWAMGGAARWWLEGSLRSLSADLARAGATLVLRRGRAAQIIPALAEAVGAGCVHAGIVHEPAGRAVDAAVGRALANSGRRLVLHPGATLIDPERIRTGGGTVYGVYSPFARAAEAAIEAGGAVACLAAPRVIAGVGGVESDDLAAWGLRPAAPDWAGGFRALWQPGEAGAGARLRDFLESAVRRYGTARNLPGRDGTSMLSPHLHFGEISPRAVWEACRLSGDGADRHSYLRELLWRDFAAYSLWHHPYLPEQPLRPAFATLPWRDDPAGLRAWQLGQTGVPIVDAGMRQLWQTGWMHNRVRMIAASFLVKHLLISWQAGSAWFWDTLVDADLASNSASWQWVTGCGIDSQPFFRVFNPVMQGRKFDADGAYVRRYVPELALLPDAFLHAPWEASPLELAAAGVRLGRDYPHPLVDLAAGRARALAAYQSSVRELVT